MRALLASPTSAGTLPISAQVIPVGMRDDHASTQTAFVLVEVDAQGFRAIMGDVLGSTMTDAARTRTLAVDLALLPMDDGGDAAAPVTAAIATIRLSEDMRSRLSQHGFRWLHQVALPDTTRELRVAAHIDGHRSGMVITPVEPSGAASGDAPFIGAVVVASTSSGGAVTAGDFASLPFAKAIPTTRRVFEAGDVLEFAVGIVTDGTAVVEDDVIVTLTSTGGRARQITLDPAGAGFHAGMMPLAGYPAGDHAVEVSARFVAGSERRVLPLCVR